MRDHTIKKHLTIGYISSSLHFPWIEFQLGGIVEGATSLDVNLFIIPGGRLDSLFPDENYQNIIYSIGGYETLDGLIIWGGGFDDYVSHGRLKEFVESFHPVPIVMVEHAIPGIPVVKMDCYTPLKEEILHLIQVHHAQKIGYIRGSSNHIDEKARFRAYQDALAEAGIPYRHEWVLPPFMQSVEDEVEVLRMMDWYKMVGTELDAFASFNDQRLFYLINAMERLNKKIPADQLVCGYDDIRQAKFHDPPVTTIRAPFQEMGVKALELVIQMIKGEEVPLVNEFRGRVQLRESCGCPYKKDWPIQLQESRSEVFRMGKVAHRQFLINQMSSTLTILPGVLENQKNFIEKFGSFLKKMGILDCRVYLLDQAFKGDRRECLLSPLSLYFESQKGDGNPSLSERIQPSGLFEAIGKKYEDRFDQIVFPLSYKQSLYGILLLGMEFFDGSLYQSLQVLLGAFFEEYLLLEEISTQADTLRKMNTALKTSIEELNSARDRLVQSEKMAALSNLIGGVAHKINTPLGVALTTVTYLQQKYLDFLEQRRTPSAVEDNHPEKDLQEGLALLEMSIKKTADLVNEFKTISTAQGEEQGMPIGLKQFCEEMNDRIKFRWKNAIDFTYVCSEDIVINSLPSVLSQIIAHLVENSIVHGVGAPSRIQISIRTEKQALYLTVEDDGPGIPTPLIGKVFDPFFTTVGGNERPGLGLYIVYNLVTQVLKGKIECENPAHGGVLFSIVFPVVIV